MCDCGDDAAAVEGWAGCRPGRTRFRVGWYIEWCLGGDRLPIAGFAEGGLFPMQRQRAESLRQISLRIIAPVPGCLRESILCAEHQHAQGLAIVNGARERNVHFFLENDDKEDTSFVAN